MKNTHRKTGMMMAVLALLVVMYTPTAMAVKPGYENIDATWESPNIVVTVDTYQHNDNWYQFRFYQPDTALGVPPYSADHKDGYFVTKPFVPMINGTLFDGSNYTYTDTFDVETSGAQDKYGKWTVWLFKDGEYTSPPEEIISKRVTTTVDVPIPEFSTIAIPVIAILGFFAFCRRKQKK